MHTVRLEEAVRQHIDNMPSTSTRFIERQMGMSRSTVRDVLWVNRHDPCWWQKLEGVRRKYIFETQCLQAHIFFNIPISSGLLLKRAVAEYAFPSLRHQARMVFRNNSSGAGLCSTQVQQQKYPSIDRKRGLERRLCSTLLRRINICSQELSLKAHAGHGFASRVGQAGTQFGNFRASRGPRWCSGYTTCTHQGEPGSIPGFFACGNSAGPCRWSAGFLGDLPFTLPLHSDAAQYSPRFALIGSQKTPYVKCRPNLCSLWSDQVRFEIGQAEHTAQFYYPTTFQIRLFSRSAHAAGTTNQRVVGRSTVYYGHSRESGEAPVTRALWRQLYLLCSSGRCWN
ncbi:hypothetical protein PR048_030310 [Dryococelus australis]|uniref:Uncharacterized protein n=1 Tax=Dryococelus australis TaxID=614101 RepID=A0ABQ9G8M7_9NEOP|nr:hypothetical protein PR048_030310 [Dryococelus australis]